MESKTVKKKNNEKKTVTNKNKITNNKTTLEKKTPKRKASDKVLNNQKSKKINLKRKKGFTLIELIAVVVLLAIVSTMSVLSISSVGSTVKTKQKTNLLSSMQVQAKKYVEQTGIKKVYVDTLIKEGYVTSDKTDAGNEVIVDPENQNQTLNCYYYDFTTSEEGELKEASPVDGVCPSDIYSDAILTIKYCTSNCSNASNYKAFSDNLWIGSKTVYLKAFLSSNINVGGYTIKQTDIDNNAIWTTPDAPDIYTNGNPYIVTKDYLSTTYQVRVPINGKDYVASQFVMMDATEPVVYNVRTKINVDDGTWINQNQYIYADFEDEGSGLAAFAISTSSKTAPSASSSEWKTILGNPKNFNLNNDTDNNVITTSGVYYVYVKDVAGNISSAGQEIVVKNIDAKGPECYYAGESTEWAKSRIIKWGCKDADSGCEDTEIKSKKYTTSVKTDTIEEFVIKDKAGNSTTCKAKTVNVYVDADAPSVSVFNIKSTNGNYNSKDAKYKITGKDNHSGIDKVCFTSENSAANCTWEDNNGKDVSVTFGNQEGSGTKYTRYAFVRDKVGNISEAKSLDYTLYKYCTKLKYDANSNWSECTKKCGGGTQTRAQVDYYFNSKGCVAASQSCNNTDCCSSKEKTDNCTPWSWSYCTRECDGGTQYQYRTCSMRSKIDGSYCGESAEEKKNEGTKCNTQKCCTVGEYEDYECTSNGYMKQRRWNGCEEEYEYRTTSKGCYYEVECYNKKCPSNTENQPVSNMYYETGCIYKYEGRKIDDTDSGYCDYGWRYMACQSVYVGRCYGEYSTCDHNYNSSLGTDEGYKSDYKTSQISYCYAEKISGDRYLCNIGWVDHIYCASSSNEDKCFYHQAVYGVSSTDTTKRGNFKTASSACGS